MKGNIGFSTRQAAWLGMALALCAVLLFIGGTGNSAQAGVSTPKAAASVLSPNVTCPAGQCFTDVPPANGFYTNVNALYMDGIIGGYPCGGTGEPCDADNRPYYRPANLVSRQQMSKFVDLGRRNIADAIGTSLYISGTAVQTLVGATTSGGEAVTGYCLTPGNDCWALYGNAASGTYAAVLSGGRGVYNNSQDMGYPGTYSYANGAVGGSYGGQFYSTNDNALKVDAPSASNGRAQAWIVGTAANLNAVDIDPGALFVNGNLTVTGSKSGFVVDAMQNAGDTPLEPGDVVVMVGQSPAVLGDIPVITVKKATSAYDSSVAGVVDSALYVPDAATRAAYQKQQQDIQAAEAQRRDLMSAALANGTKADLSSVKMPDASITDAQGIPHATNDPSVPTNGYLNVVTLGAYKMVKVDASFGAIHTGDLLTTSSHAGYAMKATDKLQSVGAVIGKAVGSLDSGTGTIAVFVSLK
jgi:hypothetical protein